MPRSESTTANLTTRPLVKLAHACSLPRVQPHYAVKCNPNAAILATLAAAGASFDCASQHEMQLVLSMGVSPDRIIFAHPCKVPGSHSKCSPRSGHHVRSHPLAAA